MKPRFLLAIFPVISLVLPAFEAGAQTPYSPAAPPNTSNPFAGVAAAPARTAPVRQPMQMQPGMPTSLSAVPGGFVASTQVLTSEPIDPNHKLGRGDLLSYRVEEDRDDKVWPLQVTDSGEVDLPLGGRVRAAGKTTDQLRTDIKAMLEREYYYHATVTMGLNTVAPRASRGRISVGGAVKVIGSQELPVDSPLTASQAVYQAGGLVDFSNPKRAYVLRNGTKIPTDLKAVENGDAAKDVVLQPGDKVIVPEAKIGIKF